MLTQEFLKKIINYDKNTGIFTWKVRSLNMFSHCKNPQRARKTWNTRFSETIAGSIMSLKKANVKYIVMTVLISGIKKRRYLAHKLAFLYESGNYDCGHVDHIDHNGLNNSWENLRIVTHQENKKNIILTSANTSGVNGVTWNKNKNKWQAQLSTTINGKKVCKYGGLFEDFNDAIEKENK